MKVQCEQCKHFWPNPMNPLAGMGRCKLDRDVYNFPAALHACKQYDEKESRDAIT